MERLPYNLNVALELAGKKLQARTPEDLARAKKVIWKEERREIHCPSLGDLYCINYPSGEIRERSGQDVDPRFQVLLLHYLTSPGTSVHGEWISFKELPGGALYRQPFYGRAIGPLIKTFGSSPVHFLEAGLALGGQTAGVGDAGIILYPFPLVPVCIALWAGDEEIPPNGTILFDASVTEHLPTEDCAVLAEYLVRRLKKAVPQ